MTTKHMKDLAMMGLGLTQIATGLVAILTLGFYSPTWSLRYSLKWREAQK